MVNFLLWQVFETLVIGHAILSSYCKCNNVPKPKFKLLMVFATIDLSIK